MEMRIAQRHAIECRRDCEVLKKLAERKRKYVDLFDLTIQCISDFIIIMTQNSWLLSSISSSSVFNLSGPSRQNMYINFNWY